MTNDRKVYVVNRGGHDYSAAERYGRLIFLTEGTMPRYNTNQMFREISESMHDSTSDDYLLLTSLTTLNVIAAGIFAHKHGRINLLLYQGRKNRGAYGEYLERTIVFTQLAHIVRKGDGSDRGTDEEKGSEESKGDDSQNGNEDTASQGDNGEHTGAGRGEGAAGKG